MNEATKNIHVQFFVDIYFELIWVNSKQVIAGLYGKTMFSFERN